MSSADPKRNSLRVKNFWNPVLARARLPILSWNLRPEAPTDSHCEDLRKLPLCCNKALSDLGNRSFQPPLPFCIIKRREKKKFRNTSKGHSPGISHLKVYFSSDIISSFLQKIARYAKSKEINTT